MSTDRLRIVLRLDPLIEFERDLASVYDSMPRYRRQEWLRQALRSGFAALRAKELAGVDPLLDGPTVVSPIPIQGELDAKVKPVALAQNSEPAAPMQLPPSEPVSAKGIFKGFFGEVDGSQSIQP